MVRTKQMSQGNQSTSTKNKAATAATTSTSTGAITRDRGSTVSEAVVYEQALNRVANETELLIMKSDGTPDIATTFVYSMFEVMRT